MQAYVFGSIVYRVDALLSGLYRISARLVEVSRLNNASSRFVVCAVRSSAPPPDEPSKVFPKFEGRSINC
jgi:hypothetical protein